MAVWEVHWRGEADGWRKNPTVAWLQGPEKEGAEKAFWAIWEVGDKWLRGEEIYCSIIAVHPGHQKRGIGQLLIDWGLDVGEKLQVPVYLESTRAGLVFYTKLGFEKLSRGAVVKAEVTHVASDFELPVTVKMPSAARRMGFEG
ncbi:conserved hypothetical protein [Histoplasma capsulatum var. duboisii H88]|uniref:N-acetyltransferase domain-containing protein n=1 Tax=Ajellomyces capsulatus (strain H88) TaxID=544711 RepID=F0U727_AJEC8|nr:conserved hypothetical protein [Histoplasma capsulatum var. duboisii H88]